MIEYHYSIKNFELDATCYFYKFIKNFTWYQSKLLYGTSGKKILIGFFCLYHTVSSSQAKRTSRLVCDQVKISRKILIHSPNLEFNYWIIHLKI